MVSVSCRGGGGGEGGVGGEAGMGNGMECADVEMCRCVVEGDHLGGWGMVGAHARLRMGIVGVEPLKGRGNSSCLGRSC